MTMAAFFITLLLIFIYNKPGRCVSTTESASSSTQSTPETPTYDQFHRRPQPSDHAATSPCICTMQYDPVCCDEKTYSNSCMARCNAASHCEPGRCVPTSTTTTSGTSTEVTPETPTYDQYHRRPQPIDNTVSSPRPCICTMQYDPVCCDGKTYSNPCMARCNGVASDSQCAPGRCVSTTESGSSTDVTPETPTYDQYHRRPIPIDHTATSSAPCICAMQYFPVCCNGKTYSNLCMARCDGVPPDAQCAPKRCVSTTESGSNTKATPETPTYDQYHRRPIPVDNDARGADTTATTVAAVRGVAKQSEDSQSRLNAVPGYIWILVAVLFVLFTVFFALWLRTKQRMDSMINSGNASYVEFQTDTDATI